MMSEYHLNSHHSDATNQVTACWRCRKQKLRCSREKPSCKRCQDISTICTYPAPPDRKLLAAQRTQNAKARALRDREASPGPRSNASQVSNSESSGFLEHHPSVESASQEADSVLPESWAPEGSHSSYRDPSGSLPPAPFALRQVAFPSPEIALALTEIYFSRLYNSSLLFHKQTLLANLQARTLPDFVFLSIFAIASIYLQNSEEGYKPKSPMPLSDVGKLGNEWATAAGQQVLANIDQPQHENIPTCLNLALYWFSQGQTDRTDTYALVAYRTCRLLGYHVQPASGTEIDLLYGEVKRRCYWACWITHCISQENANFKAQSSWKEVIGLPLPCDEDSFQKGHPIIQQAFDDSGEIVRIENHTTGPIKASLMGELAKIISLWWEIQRFVRSSVNNERQESSKRLAMLHRLDRKLEVINAEFPPELRYTQATAAVTPNNNHHLIFYLNAIHHLCACALHSSIVPVFSNIARDAQISVKLARMSAEEAVKHSGIILDMAANFSKKNPSASSLPSMTGYAMYVASSIQFKSLGAQGKLGGHAVGKLHPAVSILYQLKAYYFPLQALWTSLSNLFQSAGVDINMLYKAKQLHGQPDGSTNIDLIVTHRILPSSDGENQDSLYTYVPAQVDKSKTVSRSSTANLSPSGDSQAQLRTSPTPMPIIGNVEGQVEKEGRPVTSPLPVRHQPINTAMYQPIQEHLIYQVQPPSSLQIHGVGGAMPDVNVMQKSAPSGYVPVSEGRHGIEIDYPETQSMVQAAHESMVSGDLDMGIQPCNFWWDQPPQGLATDGYDFLVGSYPSAPETYPQVPETYPPSVPESFSYGSPR